MASQLVMGAVLRIQDLLLQLLGMLSGAHCWRAELGHVLTLAGLHNVLQVLLLPTEQGHLWLQPPFAAGLWACQACLVRQRKITYLQHAIYNNESHVHKPICYSNGW